MSDKKPTNDLLARYAIYLAAKEMDVSIEDSRISVDEIRNVEHQISTNPELSEYISFLQQNYINLYQNLDESQVGHITIKPIKKKYITLISHRFKSPIMRYASAAIVMLFLTIISLPLISKMVTPGTYPIVQESLDIVLPVLRGESGFPLESGKDLFNKGLYFEAINSFSNEFQKIKKDNENETVIFAYYLCLTYLKQAQQSTFSLFTRYHSAYLDSSFRYLELARLTVTNRVILQRDIFWRLGIVETLRYSINNMNENYTNAERFLVFLVENDGRNIEGAIKLLKKLRELKNK